MRRDVPAFAKVNLCLFLGPVRRDGRHELVTLMEPLSLADVLAVETLTGGPDVVVCPAVEGPNLASTALAALRAGGWDGPFLRVTIDKRIPVAGGLGGGSADAAAILRLAAQLAPVAPGTLAEIAAALGSDVPGLLDPGPALVTGAGEVLEPLPGVAPHAVALVPQPFGLSAAEVYAQADRMGLPRSAGELARCHTELVSALVAKTAPPLVNDLQTAALSLAPEIGEALESLQAAGADYAIVSGSGPTTVGIFWDADALERARAAVSELTAGWPGATVALPAPRPLSPSGLLGGAQSARR